MRTKSRDVSFIGAVALVAISGLLFVSTSYGRPPGSFYREPRISRFEGERHDPPGFIRPSARFEPEHGPAVRIVSRPRRYILAPPRGHVVVRIGGLTYYQYGHVYYRRVYLDDHWVYVETVPVGVTLVTLPESPDKVIVNGQVYYRTGSTFYVEKPQATISADGTTVLSPAGYTAVRPPVGAMIDSLPEGSIIEPKGSTTYYRADDVYFLPVKVGEAEKYVVVTEPK